LDEQFNVLLGRGKATTGIMPEGTLKQRVALVEAISYPSL
jgi:hypothetical protein